VLAPFANILQITKKTVAGTTVLSLLLSFIHFAIESSFYAFYLAFG